jgi:hypothetical protein
MAALSQVAFLRTMPDALRPHLPLHLRDIKVHQPWRWLIQLHYGEPLLHFEVVRAMGRAGYEIGLHFEARDRELNQYLLDGFCRHLLEIKDTLGETIEAEMWDRGWTKVYEVYPLEELTTDYQQEVAQRLAALITCLQPILQDLRQRR